MICKRSAKKFCKDDISKIENYDKAVADTTQTWICHHRNGIDRSREELKSLGLYENRPASELIFLTKSEHRALHGAGERHYNYGKHLSDVTKKKITESLKGKPRSAETKQKISAYWARRKLAQEVK